MRYFPQRARRKTDIGRKLKICTYCLGDLFADGRCVQCDARSTISPLPEQILGPAIVRPRPLLN
jgi:hypothetical protein